MKLPAFLFLFLSSVTISSAHADTDALGGRWRGSFSSPSSENVIELQFDQSAGVYCGHYQGTTQSGTSFPVNELGRGQPIRIVVPNVGIFQVSLHGDVLEGTFTCAAGTGPFRLDKAQEDRASEPDYLQLVN